jgi:CheY-like chemotaxis protein/HPt (histidine-containing phosphotransfer) domain-containing protein
MKQVDGPFEVLTLREDTEPMALAPQPHQLLLATADPALATRLRRLLELIGHRVDSCPSGRETLRRWRAGGVDLLLLDTRLPDIDGPALARQLRSDEMHRHLPRLPIVALRPGTPGPDIDAALEQPVYIPALQALLQRWLVPHAEAGADAEGAGAVVDLRVLQRLVGDDPAVVCEMLRDYLASAREQAGLLRRAYHLGDPRQVAALVHKLKSASLAVGALQLGELCAAMELPVQTDFDAVGNDHARFNHVFDATVAAVQAHLKGLEP